LVEEEIERLDVYPLQKNNIVVQQDAYRRLGGSPDYEDDAEPFAFFEFARKEKDTDLRFAIEFAELYFLLTVEGIGTLSFDYGLFHNEKDGASQVISALKMLANGQLAALITSCNGAACAVEFLLYDAHSRTPEVAY
jgi:hypothetical protein